MNTARHIRGMGHVITGQQSPIDNPTGMIDSSESWIRAGWSPVHERGRFRVHKVVPHQYGFEFIFPQPVSMIWAKLHTRSIV